VYEDVRTRLLALVSARDPERRATDMAALVAAGQPLVPMLLDPGMTGPMMLPLLEVLTRRYYGRKQLHNVRTIEAAGHRAVVADLRDRDRQARIVAAAGDDLGELLALTRMLADESTAAPGGLALDAYLTSGDAPPERGARVAGLLPQLQAEAASALERVTVTIATETPHGFPRVQQLTFRRGEGGWSEDRHLRGIHPLVADRLAMWRFARFELTRLASSDDVYLLQGIARENSADVRLFALAEVRDLTPTEDDRGEITALPELERVLAACLDDLRQARAGLSSRRQPDWNRVVLDIWPVVAIPTGQLDALIDALAPLSTRLGLEEVTIMARTPDPDGRTVRRCLRIRPTPGHGMTLRITKLPRRPLRPLDELTSRVIHARRRGTIHPSELLPMVVRSPDASRSHGPPGRFEEHDLDATGSLRPVVREPGHNPGGIVVGVVTSATERYPDGLVRVALLSDATRNSGSLAEPECRRIVAALDLAQDLGVPVEWFAMSSGARIAMDSGTENLDWTSRPAQDRRLHTGRR
jgi:hypothetical protein